MTMADTTVPAGELTKPQFNLFADTLIEQSSMLKEARVIRMADGEGVADIGGIVPSAQKHLRSAAVTTPFELTWDGLDRNTDGSLTDDIIRAMAKQTAGDLEDIAIQGHTVSSDAFLRSLNGWRSLASLDEGHRTYFGGDPLDRHALGKLFCALPDAYKRNYSDLRFFCATGATNMEVYCGVPIIQTPHIPDRNGYAFLTPRDNLLFGIHHDVRIEKEHDILTGQNVYAITARIAVDFEETDAVVVGINIGTEEAD